MMEGRTAFRIGVALAVFGVLAGGVGVGMAVLVTSQQCGSDGNCAEWVQAIGSLIALLVAILVPVLLQAQANRDARRRDAARVRSAALRLLPLLRRLHGQAEAVARWDGRREGGSPVFVDPERADALPVALEVLVASQVPGWDDALLQAGELGAIGESVHLALRMVQESAAQVSRSVSTERYRSGDAVVLQSLRGRIRETELALDRAIRVLEALFPRAADDALPMLSGMDRRMTMNVHRAE